MLHVLIALYFVTKPPKKQSSIKKSKEILHEHHPFFSLLFLRIKFSTNATKLNWTILAFALIEILNKATSNTPLYGTRITLFHLSMWYEF